MNRLVAAAAAIALPFALLGARPIDAPTARTGVAIVTYWLDDGGPLPVPLSAAQYAKAVRDGSCGPRSSVVYWPARNGHRAEVQVVCSGA